MQIQKQTQGHLAAFLTIFIWGITFVSIKVLIGPFTPVEIIFFRLALALLALWIVQPPRFKWTGRGELRSLSLREELKYMAAGLCGVTLYMLFQNTALSYTLASNVSVLISVAPLFTALVARIFLKEEALKASFFLGFAVAIAGIVLIAFNGNFILKLNPLGDILAILAAVVWAFYSVLVKKISVQQSAMVQATRKVFFYGLLFLLPILPLSDFRLGLERLAVLPNLLNLLFLGVGASALCFATWNFAVTVLGPVKTSVYIYMTPVITIAASALLLDEKITPVAAVGVVLILGGMYLSERKA
jgi:drug/metabolite transporter (DMT)-like permease